MAVRQAKTAKMGVRRIFMVLQKHQHANILYAFDRSKSAKVLPYLCEDVKESRVQLYILWVTMPVVEIVYPFLMKVVTFVT